MDGQGQTLYWFSNEKVKIEVPFFQRPYVWDEDEWEEMIISIENATNENMPFIGSFILQKIAGSKKYLVIDGQQRITTLSVMIKAYIDNFKELPTDSKPEFLNIIYEKALINLKPIYSSRLIPSNIDKIDFCDVMSIDLIQDNIKDRNGKIVQAYKYFSKYFSNNTSEKNMMIGAKIITNNKFFITIILDENDDEQKIFDSVNSLGKDLTNSDIIKNYLFQRIKTICNNDSKLLDKILENHEKYWMNIFYSDDKREFWKREKILGRIKTNNLESFLKDFATIKRIYIPSETGGIDGLAKAYKNYIKSKADYEELFEFLKEIADYAECYYNYIHEYETLDYFKIDDLVNTTLLILEKTDITTFNPYIMKLLKERPDNLNELLWALQKFLVQRLIYKEKTKNYNKVCDNLLGVTKDPVAYLQQYNKNEAMGLGEYPIGLKKINNKPATLVLFLIELINRRGEEKKYCDVLRYNKTLEHIIPQKWQTHWSSVPCFREIVIDNQEPFFEKILDIKEISEYRKNMIYCIGNMTLLSGPLNSSISNESFAVKIEGNKDKQGIKKYVGSLSVAQEIVDIYNKNKEWTEKDIIIRNKKIFDILNGYYNFLN